VRFSASFFLAFSLSLSLLVEHKLFSAAHMPISHVRFFFSSVTVKSPGRVLNKQTLFFFVDSNQLQASEACVLCLLFEVVCVFFFFVFCFLQLGVCVVWFPPSMLLLNRDVPSTYG
jgi:hypothetical protein